MSSSIYSLISSASLAFQAARLLTNEEIENMLDFITPNPEIPYEVGQAIVEINKKPLREQLKAVMIDPIDIPTIKNEIKYYYDSSQIIPGESVGISCSQSLGERQTQMTLNVFHKAGDNATRQTSGTSRFQELLNATLNQKTTCCKIFFNKKHKSIQELRKTVGNKITELTLEKICLDITCNTNKIRESWYELYEKIYDGNKLEKIKDKNECITLKINPEYLYEYKLTLEYICNVIENEWDDITCIFSPIQYFTIDVYPDMNNITLPEDRVLFISEDNANEIYLEECVQPNLEKLMICGIKGIKEIFYVQDNNDKDNWILETEGSNLTKLFSNEDIDTVNTISNDIWEIYNTLGIEATREFLVEEYGEVMEGVNDCHIKLLVERMTFTGTISSITRYTMRKDESGPFGKASFEESMDNFIKAAVSGDIEHTTGVSAAITCGKQASVGTGIFNIKVDIDNLPVIEEEVIEHYE